MCNSIINPSLGSFSYNGYENLSEEMSISEDETLYDETEFTIDNINIVQSYEIFLPIEINPNERSSEFDKTKCVFGTQNPDLVILYYNNIAYCAVDSEVLQSLIIELKSPLILSFMKTNSVENIKIEDKTTFYTIISNCIEYVSELDSIETKIKISESMYALIIGNPDIMKNKDFSKITLKKLKYLVENGFNKNYAKKFRSIFRKNFVKRIINLILKLF